MTHTKLRYDAAWEGCGDEGEAGWVGTVSGSLLLWWRVGLDAVGSCDLGPEVTRPAELTARPLTHLHVQQTSFDQTEKRTRRPMSVPV